jgi:hypothetical protein
MTDWQQPAPQWPPPAPPTAWGPLPPYIPPAPPGPAPVAPKPRHIIGLSIAAVAVLLAGLFALNSVNGGADEAKTPEQAVQRFFDALDKEDAIGMLESLSPAERDIFTPAIRGLAGELTRLGIIGNVDLGRVPGVDFKVEGLQLRSEEVMPGIARVTLLAGTLSVSTVPDKIPVGDVLRKLIEANGGDVSLDRSTSSTDLDGSDSEFLVAVQQGRGWSLSLGFTIAEQARHAADAPLPDPAKAVKAVGASSPDEAVKQFLDAAADLDLERVIALMPPDEMAPLQLYAQLFLPDVKDSIDSFKQDNGFTLAIRDLDLRDSSIAGGTRVQVKGGTVEIDERDGHLELTVDAEGCVTATAHGSFRDSLGGDFGDGNKVCPSDVKDKLGDQSGALDALQATVGRATVGILVVSRGGKFFVSPTRTIFDVVLQVLKAVDRKDLEEGGSLFKLFTGQLDFGFNSNGFDSNGFSSDFSSFSSVGSCLDCSTS